MLLQVPLTLIINGLLCERFPGRAWNFRCNIHAKKIIKKYGISAFFNSKMIYTWCIFTGFPFPAECTSGYLLPGGLASKVQAAFFAPSRAGQHHGTDAATASGSLAVWNHIPLVELGPSKERCWAH